MMPRPAGLPAADHLSHRDLAQPTGGPAGRALLPNEPAVRDWPREQALTDRHLAPVLADLEAFLLWMRAELDARLSRAKPSRQGKRYPLGQCLEISRAAKLVLAGLSAVAPPPGPAARGRDALHGFMAAGGTVRQVWGDLRGAYFQNAFLIGTLYVDIANDTVVASKPKVEILPFERAGFGPVRDYLHYATVARRYWDARVLPNHLVPALAPWFPAITIIPGGGVQLDAPTYYMIGMTRAGAFAPSEALLAAPPLEAGLFGFLAQTLGGAGRDLPASAQAGRAAALQACRGARNDRWEADDKRAAEAVLAVLEVNRVLARLAARHQASGPLPAN